MKIPKKQPIPKRKKTGTSSAQLMKINRRQERQIAESSRAEIAMHELKETYRTIFENNGTANVLIETTTVISLANKEFERLSGYSKKEIEGKKKWTEFVLQEDLERMLEQHTLRRNTPTAALNHYEFRFVDRSKNIHNIYLTIDLIPGTTRSVASLLDITERKKAEEAIRQREEQFRTLFISMSEGFYLSEILYDKKGNPCDYRYLEVNPKFEQIMGLSRDKIVGKRYKELVPIDTTQWLETYCKVAHTGKPCTYEFYSNEYQKYFETFSYKPSPDRVCVLVVDITERKRTEEALNQTNETLRTMLEALPVAIFDLDTNGVVKDIWNSAAERLLGWSRQEALGHVLPSVATDEAKKEFEYFREQIRSGKSIAGIDMQRTRKDGSPVEYSLYAAPLHDSKKQITGNIAILVDVSERKRMEDALRQSEARLTAFMNYVPALILIKDHELRPIYANDNFRQFFPFDEWKGKKPHEQFPKDIADHMVAKDIDALNQGFTAFEENWTDKQGRPHTFLTQKFRINNPNNTPLLGAIILDITERKRAEEALRESEELFDKFMTNLPAVVFIKDQESRLLYANSTLKDLMGWHTAVGKLSSELLPPELAQRMITDDKEIIENGPKIVHEKVSDIHGVAHFFETHKFPFSKKNNEILIGGVSIDETARKQAEEQLLIKDFAIESSHSAIGLSDLDGKFIFANIAFVDLWRYKEKNEILGKRISDFVVSKELAAEIQTTIRSGKPFIGEAKSKTIDGVTFDIQILANMVTSPDGTPICMMASFVDISERKRMETRIRLSEEHYRTLVETTPDAIIILSGTGTVMFASRKSYEVFGIPVNQPIIGKSILDWIVPEQYGNVMSRLYDIFSGHAKPESREYALRKSDGTTFWGEINSSRLINPQGEVTGLLLICRDVSERKTAAEALLASEKRLQKAQMIAHVGNWELDLKTKKMWGSEEAFRIYGLERKTSELPLEVVQSLVFIDDRIPLDRALQRLISREEEYKVEFRITRACNGEFRTISSIAELEVAADGTPEKVVGVIQDITERKKADEDLQRSEVKYREMVEQINDIIFSADADGIYTYISPASEIINGYKPEEIIGHSIEEFLDPLFIPKHQRQFQKIISGNLSPSEYRVKIKSGEYRWFRSSSKPIFDGERLIGIRGVLTDITERKKAEETVSLLSHTIKSIHECVSVTGLDNSILYVNQAFLETYGYTEEEVLGKDIHDFVSTMESDKQEILSATLHGEWHGERINRKKDGTEFPIHLSTSTVRDEEGAPIALVGVATDITEQKKLQQELLQSQKMQSIGTLAGGIAHDFNNILGIILGYASLLERQKHDDSKHAESIDAINQAVYRGAALVRQILTFARKTDVEFEVINVNDLAHELLSMLQQTFPKIVTFKEIIEKNIPYIQADRTQIHQALLNLCVNARDAMPNGGTLTIKTETVEKEKIQEQFPSADHQLYACISVADTGDGMDEAIRLRIFDPFFTTKEKGKGTGLGLSVTYGVVQAHNGFIHVKSELGHGSTFRLYFPVPDSTELGLNLQSSAEVYVSGGTETILIVEDERLLLKMVHGLLESKGYRVYTARDGMEAVHVYQEHRKEIDLVLSDMGLPEMTGAEVLRRLIEMNPDVKVALASGYFDPHIKSELLKAGAKTFIQKPYSPDEILGKLREVLDHKET